METTVDTKGYKKIERKLDNVGSAEITFYLHIERGADLREK